MDIRTWARENGVDVNTRGPVNDTARAAYAAAHAGDELPAVDRLDDVPTGLDELDPAGRLDMPPSRERQPTRPPPATSAPGWMNRRTKPAGAGAAKPPRRRVSIDGVVSGVWGIASMFLARNERALPVARMLTMQAPAAGLIVEDIAKNTLLDRVLQPFARAGKTGEQIGALIGPPILVAAITANPALYPMLAPVLKMTLMSWMEISAPVMKKAREKAEKLSEEFGGLEIDLMIEMLFAPPPGDEVPAAAGGNVAGPA